MAMLRSLKTLALSAVFGAGAIAAGPEYGVTVNDDAVYKALGIVDYSMQTFDLPPQAGEPFDVQIKVDAQNVKLVLEPYSLRAADFQAYVNSGDGKVEFDAEAPTTYRGYVPGLPASEVRASLIDGQLYAQVKFGNGDPALYVEPLTSAVKDADPRLHMVYEATDVDWGDLSCGVDDVAGPGNNLGILGPSPAAVKVAELGLDSDYQFFDLLANDNVDTAIQQIELIINAMDNIYENDVEIMFEIKTIIIRDNPNDPYNGTDAGGLLNQVRAEWLTNQTAIKHDLAQMVSGVNFAGSTIGIAWVGSVCTTNRYSTIQAVNLSLPGRIGVSAHEIGHNFNAQHCDGFNPCNIMCSGLGGCSGNISTFAPVSKSAILNFKNLINNCLDDPILPPPPPVQTNLPFLENAEDFVLDVAQWYVVEGADTSGAASNPPSGFVSVLMNADDTITTQQIKTLDLLNPPMTPFYLSFWSETTQMEGGETLLIEYFSELQQQWLVLDTIVADSGSMNTFELFEYEMPVQAYGDVLQVRFTVDNDAADSWFLDDISVSVESVGGCAGDFNGDGQLNVLDFVAYQTAFINEDPAADCDDNGQFNVLDFVCFQAAFTAGCN